MEQLLEPLRTRLDKERLLEADWPQLVEGLAAFANKHNIAPAEAIVKFYGQPMSEQLVDELVASEKRRLAIKDRSKNINIDRIVVNFLKGNLFFMEVSRWIKKQAGFYWKNIPIHTAAMCYDVERDDFVMVYNPEFFASFLVDFGDDEGTKILEGIFHHELYHFTLKHVTLRRRMPAFGWNIATDAANNSLILAAGGKLPDCGVIPGKKWGSPETRVDLRRGLAQRTLSPEEEKLQEGLGELIHSWERMQTSEWYFTDLMKWAQANGHKVGNKGITPAGTGCSEVSDIFDNIDSHDLWDEIPEEARELMKEKAKNIMKGATRRADNQANGWGNIPVDVQKAMRAYIDDRIDWDAALRNFVGSFQRGVSRRTFKRINRRAPYDHPGTKRTHLPNIAICIDQSGSVDDEQLHAIFGVLGSLAKKVTFTVVPFDSAVHVDDIFEWKKGTAPPLKRVAQGGTDFRAVCDYINSGSAGRFDGYVICTDGECSDPGSSKIRRAWVITPGHKLYFVSKDLVMNMDDKKARKNDPLR